MKPNFFGLVSFFLLSAIPVFAQNLEYVQKDFSIASSILGEKRTGNIFLPEDMPSNLPVLYVLDGEWNHELASAIVGHFIRWNRIPDMAVVSLHNINRTRDFTPTEDDQRYPGSGGAEKFLEFVKRELIPHMEKKYHFSDQRILFGHSFGGLFSLYTLKSEPAIFDAYIAVSPSVWWKDEYMYGDYALNESADKPFLYVTVGTNDRGNTQALEQYIGFLAERGYDQQLELYHEIHEGEDHFTNVPATLHQALKKLFPEEQFQREAITAWQEGGHHAVQNWYEQSRAEYGFRFRLPEEAIRTYAYELHSREGKTVEALNLLSWLASVYDESYQVFYFLGAIAEEDVQPERAILNYKKALEVGNMPDRMRVVIERKLANIEGGGS